MKMLFPPAIRDLIKEHYGSYEDVLRATTIEENIPGLKIYDRETALDLVKKKAVLLNRYPGRNDFTHQEYSEIYRLFGHSCFKHLRKLYFLPEST